ncbi:MAG: hypothetical protein AAGE52_24530 [Myxococcota bacterium]
MRASEADPISHDGRLKAIFALLVPAFIGHTIQLLSEDVPWAPWAWPRYWWTPGWHLYLPPWVVIGIAVALAVAVIGVGVRRTRRWAIALIVLYIAHYLTYPYRIRNHMTYMLASLSAIGGAWLIGRLSGAKRASRLVDRYAAAAVATAVCVSYFFAGLHKTNAGFLQFNEVSSAYEGVQTFWVYGDLGEKAPTWAVAIAIYGTLAVEYTVPLIARLVRPARVFMILALMAFHFPHVAVMNVADYPMIASAFYPALFDRAHWRILERELYRPTRWNVGGAILGAAAQCWWIPWIGGLTVFGILVCMIWGWGAGSMLRMTFVRTREGSVQRSSGND